MHTEYYSGSWTQTAKEKAPAICFNHFFAVFSNKTTPSISKISIGITFHHNFHSPLWPVGPVVRSSPFPPPTTVNKTAVVTLWLKSTIKQRTGAWRVSHRHQRDENSLGSLNFGPPKNILHLSYVLKLLLLFVWCRVSLKTETGGGRMQNTIVIVGGNIACDVIQACTWSWDFGVNVELIRRTEIKQRGPRSSFNRQAWEKQRVRNWQDKWLRWSTEFV